MPIRFSPEKKKAGAIRAVSYGITFTQLMRDLLDKELAHKGGILNWKDPRGGKRR